MVVGQEFEVVLVELEGRRKLGVDLMNCVQKLEEDRREGPILIRIEQIRSVIESVSECEPLLFDQNSKAFQSSVVRIEAELSEAGDL